MKHKLLLLILSNYFKTHRFFFYWHRKTKEKLWVHWHKVSDNDSDSVPSRHHKCDYVYIFPSLYHLGNKSHNFYYNFGSLQSFCFSNDDSWKIMSKPRDFSLIPTVSIHFPFRSHTYLPLILSHFGVFPQQVQNFR